MKKLFVLSVLLVVSTILFAQDKDINISLRSSVSMPVGDYQKADVNVGSFANTGVSFSAKAVWFFWKNFGAGIDVSYSVHTVNASKLATQTVLNDPFMEDLVVRSEPFNMISITGGLYYRYKIGNKISVNPGLSGGILIGKTPFQLYEPKYFLVGPDYYKITSSRDQSFAFKAGISLIYDVNSCISLSLDSDYTHSKLSFGYYTSTGYEVRNRNISYFDIGLSLMLKF